MKTEIIHIDNLKCGGCANTIKRKLLSVKEVFEVLVEEDTGRVEIRYDGGDQRERFLKILSALGYPIAGTTTLTQKAKSYVSCAIGRLKPEK